MKSILGLLYGGIALSAFVLGINKRNSIAEGLASQVQILSEAGINSIEAQEVLLMTQYFDTRKDLAASQKSKVMFVPVNPGGLTDVRQQIVESLEASNLRDK